ncbi:MAG: patatin family protein [Clostridiales bacterium]|nr:patatin family protein [Clostridiales bacterium]
MTGLIDIGGGMRGVYGAGVLDCFLEHGLDFDYCLGVSAGSANIASFLAKQKERGLRFYTVHAADRRFMSLRNFMKTKSYFGLDFIYRTLTDELDPIDYDTLLSSKSKIRVVATRADNGKPHYFTNEDFQKNNSEVLKASCALPMACLPVEIKGELYFDGGVADPIPVKKALDDGCDKLVVILTKPFDFVMGRERTSLLHPCLLKKYPAIIKALDHRRIRYRRAIRLLRKLEKEGRALIISPSQKYKINTGTKDRQTLKGFYRLGYNDALQKIEEIGGHAKNLSACHFLDGRGVV